MQGEVTKFRCKKAILTCIHTKREKSGWQFYQATHFKSQGLFNPEEMKKESSTLGANNLFVVDKTISPGVFLPLLF